MSTREKGDFTNRKREEEGLKGKFHKGDTEGESKEQLGGDHVQVTDQDMQWLPQKIIKCGRATGVLVDACPGGWTAMVEFAQRREKQNRDELR